MVDSVQECQALNDQAIGRLEVSMVPVILPERRISVQIWVGFVHYFGFAREQNLVFAVLAFSERSCAEASGGRQGATASYRHVNQSERFIFVTDQGGILLKRCELVAGAGLVLALGTKAQPFKTQAFRFYSTVLV